MADILVVKGRGVKNGEGPLPLREALDYFSDIPAFLHKIDDVDQVRALAHPDSYLVTHKPIGALNYYVTVVYALQVVKNELGMTFKPLDFDHEKIKSEHQVIKGFCDGELVAKVLAPDRTGIDFYFNLSLEFPVPMALKLAPRGLLQSTADGLMNLKVGLTVDAFYKKVMEDLKLPA